MVKMIASKFDVNDDNNDNSYEMDGSHEKFSNVEKTKLISLG